jgi:hypothetical protein
MPHDIAIIAILVGLLAVWAVMRRSKKPDAIVQPVGEPFTPIGGPVDVRYHGRDWQILGGLESASWACRGTLEDGHTYEPAHDPMTGISGWYLPGNVGSAQGCEYWRLERDGTSTIDTRGRALDVHWGQFLSREFHHPVPIRTGQTVVTLRLWCAPLDPNDIARYVVGFVLRDREHGAHYLEIVPLRTQGYDFDPDPLYDRRQKRDIRYLWGPEAARIGKITMTWNGDICGLTIPVCEIARQEDWQGQELMLSGVYIGHEVRGPAVAQIRIEYYEGPA